MHSLTILWRGLRDLLAAGLLQLAALLLSPGLLIAGRSVRAKVIGLRGLLLAGAGVLAAGVGFGPGGAVTMNAVVVVVSALAAVEVGLYWTRPRLTYDVADAVEGGGTWASVAPPGRTGDARVGDENDFVGLAVQVVTRLNPLWWRGRGAEIRAVVADDLDAMADHPALERLPSVLPFGFPRGSRSCGHAFVYRPPRDPDEVLPLVVVCHGHGGNPFLGCAVWENLADDLGFVAAFPTFGYGNWDRVAGVEAVRKCRATVVHEFGADATRAVLVGVSQGGCGVTRAATAARWAGLVYVSATMEPRLLNVDAHFRDFSGDAPVLVANGLRDINVRPATVAAGVAALRSGGVTVTHVEDATADHFYLFEKRDEFADAFRAWWATIPGLNQNGSAQTC